MNIVNVKNEGYGRYEELLLLRDRLNKEANLYYMAYIREFGDLINRVYEMKIECIKRKKTIAYCQMSANHGEKVDVEKLQQYIEQEMKEYNIHLKGMLKASEEAKASKQISETDVLKIKKIYRELAKLIHPDINPATNEIPQLKELWLSLVTAYNCNSLKDMEETEILIKKALKDMDNDVFEIEIPDLGEKISKIEEEIRGIKSTAPYCYWEILENQDLINEKKSELEEELKMYSNYLDELDNMMEKIIQSGVTISWKMN